MIDAGTLRSYAFVGGLGMDGRIATSRGVLSAGLHAGERKMGLDYPVTQVRQAA